MLFNSYTFIFLFFPITLGVYVLLSKQARALRIAWLVFTSLGFYAYWKPQYLWILLSSILFNYFWGGLLEKRKQRLALGLGVSANLLLLGFYKYAGLFTRSLHELGAPVPLIEVLLPIGISFFTFQQIAYLVDAYRGTSKERNFLNYCLFVTYFPQLIAGPIVHHKEMLPQFSAEKTRFSREDFSVGISIFLFGLFKKVVFADSLAAIASPVFNAADAGAPIAFLDCWFGLAAYTLQIYFDFSGYSDMAIGLARTFGIVLPLNFDSPYKSKSISEFWRRWHITLSRFLRDYLYIPLGGNRCGPVRRYANLMITMVLGGFWHGAGWNFLVWGALHGSFLVIHQLYGKLMRGRFALPAPVSVGLTLFCVAIAWIFFRAVTFAGAWEILSGCLGANGFSTLTSVVVKKEALPWILGVGLLALLAPNTAQFHAGHNPGLDAERPAPLRGLKLPSRLQWQPNGPWLLATLVMTVITLLHLSAVTEFIYFQF